MLYHKFSARQNIYFRSTNHHFTLKEIDIIIIKFLNWSKKITDACVLNKATNFMSTNFPESQIQTKSH